MELWETYNTPINHNIELICVFKEEYGTIKFEVIQQGI